jgi:hypothetical protein
VKFKNKDSVDFLPAQTFIITDSFYVFNGLQPCAAYDFLLQPQCAANDSAVVSMVSLQTSSIEIDSVKVVNANYGRFDLQFTVTNVNGTNQSVNLIAESGNKRLAFNFNGRSQQLVIKDILADGQPFKKLLIKPAEAGQYCTASVNYKAPESNPDCALSVSANFNDCTLPAGWSNQVIRKTIFTRVTSLKIGLNNYTNNSFSRFPYGNIDGTCMLYFDFWNAGTLTTYAGYELKSPVVDATNFANLTLSFDYEYFMKEDRDTNSLAYLKVEVFDGSKWVPVFLVDSSREYKNYTSRNEVWNLSAKRIVLNLDQYKSAAMQVRFIIDDGTANRNRPGLEVAALDNILICGTSICTIPVSAIIPESADAVGITASASCTDSSGFSHFYTGSIGDSLLVSVKKVATDSLELYPGQVKLHFISTQIDMPLSAVYITGNRKWLLNKRWWEFLPSVQGKAENTVRMYFTRVDLNRWSKLHGRTITPEMVNPYYFVAPGDAFESPLHKNTSANGIFFPYYSTGEEGNFYFVEFETPALYMMGLGATADGEIPVGSPVSNLSGYGNDNSTIINWQVSNETGISQYKIERAADGINFRTVGSTAASNNLSYHFTDQSPLASGAYYRIRLLNNAGRSLLSNTVMIRMNKGKARHLIGYPNPVKDMLWLEINAEQAGVAKVLITAPDGKKLSETKKLLIAGFNRIPVVTGQLPAGVYMLTFFLQQQTFNVRFVK